ncbi:MAG: hypothetical protein HY316_05495 [Acidobacteria bacterium]|nr:hypothetical protein [Acidobacteriota bacterium]
MSVSGPTTEMTATCVYESQEVRDAVIASGLQRGAGESYDRLAALLRSQQQRTASGAASPLPWSPAASRTSEGDH